MNIYMNIYEHIIHNILHEHIIRIHCFCSCAYFHINLMVTVAKLKKNKGLQSNNWKIYSKLIFSIGTVSLNSLFYRHLGRMIHHQSMLVRSVQVFLHLPVRYLQHRQKQQLTNVRKSDYEHAVSDTRNKAIFLLQQFFNLLSLKRLWLAVLAGKKAERWTISFHQILLEFITGKGFL